MPRGVFLFCFHSAFTFSWFNYSMSFSVISALWYSKLTHAVNSIELVYKRFNFSQQLFVILQSSCFFVFKDSVMLLELEKLLKLISCRWQWSEFRVNWCYAILLHHNKSKEKHRKVFAYIDPWHTTRADDTSNPNITNPFDSDVLYVAKQMMILMVDAGNDERSEKLFPRGEIRKRRQMLVTCGTFSDLIKVPQPKF